MDEFKSNANFIAAMRSVLEIKDVKIFSITTSIDMMLTTREKIQISASRISMFRTPSDGDDSCESNIPVGELVLMVDIWPPRIHGYEEPAKMETV